MAKLTKSWINLFQNVFDSSMLNIGEMMEVTEDCDHKGHILLRTYEEIVCLDNPKSTWPSEVKFIGRKLNAGESITLTQE